MEYKLSRRALQNIEDIAAYTLENFGLEQANAYITGLRYSFQLLAENPYMGRDFDGRRRRYVYRQHVVYYTPTPNYVLVVEIRSGKQAAPEV